LTSLALGIASMAVPARDLAVFSWRNLRQRWQARGRLCCLLATLIALACVAAVVCGDVVRAAYHLRSARSSLERLDYTNAELQLARHLDVCPTSVEGHFRLARLLRRLGRVSEGLEHVRACRRLGGPRDALDLETTLLRVQEGEFTSAMERSLRELFDNDPDSFYILEAFSQGYTKTYRLHEAMDCLNRMLERQPNNVYALLRRGWIAERFGQLDAAQEDYSRAVALEPRHALARQRLGEHQFVRRKNTAAAEEHFAALHQLAPGDANAGVYLARCWVEQGHWEEARQLLDELLAAHPHDPVVLTERAKVALCDGQAARAEGWLQEAISLQPHTPHAYYQLFLCLSGQDKAAEAESFRRKYQELQDSLQRLDGLMQLAAKSPQDLRLRREIARLFSRLGEEQEAQRWLLTAMRADQVDRVAP
jgi:tetratricopeptide (TPR) repeat protein